MTTTEAHPWAPDHVDAATGAGDAIDDATRSRTGQIRDAVEGARAGAERVVGSLPDAAEQTRLRVADTTTSLQTLPDPTLRLVAAASIGLAAGLHLAGAPRLITLVAIAPAILAAGAMATRPASRRGDAR